MQVVEVVCCRMAELQTDLYRHFLQSKITGRLLSGKKEGVLPAITALRKLCNHPKLIYDAMHASGPDAAVKGFEVQ